MSIYDNNKELLSALGVEGNYSTDFEVRKAILNALGGDASICNSIYEVDLQILKIYQEGGGGSGKWKVPNGVLFYGSGWTEIPEGLDFSEKTQYGTVSSGCFQNNSSLKSINQPLKGVSWSNAFNGCGALTTISSIELTTGYAMSAMLGGIFSGCNVLTNINFVGSINCNITFPFNTIQFLGGSPPTDATLRSILTACSNANNINAKTLTLGVVNKKDSTGEWAELVAACNSKGWTINGLTLE